MPTPSESERESEKDQRTNSKYQRIFSLPCSLSLGLNTASDLQAMPG